MKRILLLVALVVIAGIAGIVRSHSKAGDFDRLVSHNASDEALGRRKVIIEADSNNLKIRGEQGDVGFSERLFGSSPSEKLTLKLPRQIALHTKGVNGALIVAELDGPVEVRGVNGRVQIAAANGAIWTRPL